MAVALMASTRPCAAVVLLRCSCALSPLRLHHEVSPRLLWLLGHSVLQLYVQIGPACGPTRAAYVCFAVLLVIVEEQAHRGAAANCCSQRRPARARGSASWWRAARGGEKGRMQHLLFACEAVHLVTSEETLRRRGHSSVFFRVARQSRQTRSRSA